MSRLGLAGLTGLEPATSDVTGRRSNQLNYNPARGGYPTVRFVAVAVTICLDLLKTDFITRSRGDIGPQHAGYEAVPSEFPNLAISPGGRYRIRTCDSRRVKPVLYR